MWSDLAAAGFDSLLTIKSTDGSSIIARGHLIKGSIKRGPLNGKAIIKSFSLFDGVKTIDVQASSLTARHQILISHIPFQLHESLLSITSNHQFSRAVGITSLTRYVKLDQLVHNLKERTFAPAIPEARPLTHWNEVVYMSLNKGTELSSFNGDLYRNLKSVACSFSTELLDRTDFWINSGWQYGHFTENSLYVKEANFRRALFLYAQLGAWGYNNEVVFSEEVPLKYLKQIYVQKGRKDGVIKYLKEQVENLEIDLERMIVEVDAK